ncbi:uncharacterized protein LOC108668666 isoform X2 [Hyalella azteca]|uniref:Uncharacterized protein LOC108668666 isoform X2 n=1 Tax=Hyalella azteca TaxID=294128 RepID=A0A8B7NCS7_HYAAZ|nr:uncharacterized protein LOC108668666 isoform X2 [Hyalella azteca]
MQLITKKVILLGWLVLLPVVSSFITYTLVVFKTNPIVLDTTQASLLSLALLKLVLLGGLRVFPINLNELFSQALGNTEFREKRDVNNATEHIPSLRHKELPVAAFPCLRRMFCEIETTAKTSDSYGETASQNDVDRHPEEEVDVEALDPQIELYTEAVRALYGYDSPTAPDSSPATERALSLMQSLTGKSCEEAYKLCSGRYTAPMIFGKLFKELTVRIKDEL